VVSFCRYLKKAPESATRPEILLFAHHLLDSGAGSSSVARKLSSLRVFFRFCVAEGITLSNPAKRIPLPKTFRRLPVVMTRDEVATVLSSAPGMGPVRLRNSAILALLYYSGLRVSEACQLRVSDVDLDAETVFISQGKGSKDRIVPLGHASLPIREYLQQGRTLLCNGNKDATLFVTQGGHSMTRQRIFQIVAEAGEAIGRRIFPHALRHSLATHLVEGGSDLPVVQAVLGHADISTTQTYLHTALGYLRGQFTYHPRAL
jgi:integrase/recombinase XerD